MHAGQGDLLWDAFVLLMLTAGAVQEPADLDRLAPLLRTAMASNT